MVFELNRMFPLNFSEIAKPIAVSRAAEMKTALSSNDLIRNNSLRLLSISMPEVEQMYASNLSSSPYQIFTGETRKSSEIRIFDIFALSSDCSFQLLSKSKDRIDIKQVWEFLSLDLWNSMLRGYSSYFDLNITAPKPLKIESDSLFMSRETGTIGDMSHLYCTQDSIMGIPGIGDMPIGGAFAFHLGALAHIKSAENIVHGDYLLRHILLKPNSMQSSGFIDAKELGAIADGNSPDINNVTPPGISVVDVEHSVLGIKNEVEEENDKLMQQALGYITGHYKMTPKTYKYYYLLGYDRISSLGLYPTIAATQQKKWGFSVDKI